MINTIKIDEIASNNTNIEFLTELIGKKYETITYEGDISVFDELSEICLIEIWTGTTIAKFSINSINYELDTAEKRSITEFINYLTESKIAFRIIDDGIYVDNASVIDTRFVITNLNRIDFNFEFLPSERAFHLTSIGIREVFVPKAKNGVNHPASSQ